MKLDRICKTGNSTTQGQCEAIYAVRERPDLMVAQGKRLDEETTTELLDVADDEVGSLIPTETVLRAAGLFLADHGHPNAMREVEAYLAGQEEAVA